jgi:hypothetical protein
MDDVAYKSKGRNSVAWLRLWVRSDEIKYSYPQPQSRVLPQNLYSHVFMHTYIHTYILLSTASIPSFAAKPIFTRIHAYIHTLIYRTEDELRREISHKSARVVQLESDQNVQKETRAKITNELQEAEKSMSACKAGLCLCMYACMCSCICMHVCVHVYACMYVFMKTLCMSGY